MKGKTSISKTGSRVSSEEHPAYGPAKGALPAAETTRENLILAQAEAILRKRFERHGTIKSPTESAAWLRMKLAPLDHEVFGVLLLDSAHRIIGLELPFSGTIGGCNVYVREIVRLVLTHNAAAIILVHNHPSGQTLPSVSDELITTQIKVAMNLIECRVLDHLIVGETITSFVQLGLI